MAVPLALSRSSSTGAALFYNSGALKVARQHPASMGFELAEAERVEQALAIARAILAAASALAISIDPTEPSRYYVFTYIVLIGYMLCSLILLFLPGSAFFHRTTPVLIQMIDVAWASVLIARTDSPA